MSEPFDPQAYLAEDDEEAFSPEAYAAAEEREQMSIARPARRNKVGRGEAFIHGGVDAIPFGQKWSAGVGSGLLNAMKYARREYGVGPRYWENIPDDISYQQMLDQERAMLARSEQDRGGWTTLGKIAGGGASMGAIPFQPIQGMSRLMQVGSIGANGTTYGLLHGLGQGDTYDQATEAAAVEAPVSGLMSLAGHAVANEAISPVAKYMWNKAPAAANYLGNKAQDLAGWLKVNSLKPNPVVAERMATLPGGEAGVGRELLSRGLGGFTKKGTEKQVEAARRAAGGEMDKLAAAYDATVNSRLNAQQILAAGDAEAERLLSRPTTETAGQKLKTLVDKFRRIYTPENPPNAQQMLELKRELGKEAYGASKQFARTADQTLDDYSRGVANMERTADASLDNAIGPQFEQANLSFRRLLGANQAAKRSASRTQGNDLFSLTSKVGAAGAGGYAALTGRPILGATGLALSFLGNKYGSQLGARGLYGLGSGLRGAANMSQNVSRYATPYAPTLASMLERQTQSAFNVPAYEFAGRTPEEEEIRLREALADAQWGQQ